MKWISVKDKLPFIGQMVLSTEKCELEKEYFIALTCYEFDKKKEKNVWNYFSSGCGCCDTDMKNVEYWMPLPEVPEEKL